MEYATEALSADDYCSVSVDGAYFVQFCDPPLPSLVADNQTLGIFLKSCFNRYRRGLETCPQAKTSKSGHAIFFFFPTRLSDEYDSAPSRKYSRPLLDVFACIG